MTTLAQQQQSLLAFLLDRPNGAASQNLAKYADMAWFRGLQVYQANGHALARSALRAAYPVVAQLLGEMSFDALAVALWHAKPPTRGDVSQWGGSLAEFLKAKDQLRDEPYLADVASVEWLLHRIGGAADGSVDAESFALLSDHDPAEIGLVLSPGCAVLRSGWPVVSIVHAHLSGRPTLEQAGQMLRSGVAEDALVWRAHLRAQVRVAQPGEADLVCALLAGDTFGTALDQAPGLLIDEWLAMAVQSGLLLGVRRAATTVNTALAANPD